MHPDSAQSQQLSTEWPVLDSLTVQKTTGATYLELLGAYEAEDFKAQAPLKKRTSAMGFEGKSQFPSCFHKQNRRSDARQSNLAKCVNE